MKREVVVPDIDSLPDPAPTPEQILIAREELPNRIRFHQALEAALDSLSPRQQQILSLLLGLGEDGQEPLKVTEVARLLGISHAAVSGTKRRALKRIRESLARAGYETPPF